MLWVESLCFLTPTWGLDPATEVLIHPGTRTLLTPARQTWEKEAFSNLRREAGLSSCPAACRGQRILAAQGLRASSARRGINSCGRCRHNSIGVADNSPTWEKPRYAQPLERKGKLIMSSQMQRKMTLPDWQENQGGFAHLQIKGRKVRAERNEPSSREEAMAGEFISVPMAWTDCTSPREAVPWM